MIPRNTAQGTLLVATVWGVAGAAGGGRLVYLRQQVTGSLSPNTILVSAVPCGGSTVWLNPDHLRLATAKELLVLGC